MRWRSCLCVIGPFALGPVFGINATSKARFVLGRAATAPLLCVAKGRALHRYVSRSLGNTTACDHGGTPCSQNLPKYRSRVLGQCGTSLVPGATPGRSQCISRMPPDVPENVAHNASPWRIDKACTRRAAGSFMRKMRQAPFRGLTRAAISFVRKLQQARLRFVGRAAGSIA